MIKYLKAEVNASVLYKGHTVPLICVQEPADGYYWHRKIVVLDL